MAERLTAKQQRFIDEYLIDLNATQAAIRAGYSEKTATSIGAENLTKPYIRTEIDKRMKSKQDSAIADQDEVLRTLTRVLRREEMEHSVVVAKKHKSSYDSNGKKKIVDEETPEVVAIPSKLSDVNKAAELLGRRYALWTDNTNVNADIGVTIIDDIPESSQTN
ncbi:terminase small subunit [Caproiciproducens galactitolivorans]|uniref:Terminase small subunit n=1 Tax=Caproiciproducens galactitolivorans TaxID=642589 RepID=A0ABT4BWE9_9FIRM|nr:terminase small subunit [Caproiciproducens galactitolivorans]MCY1715214.1 terminase small subunit [Caproiciproducens galactitolivorans]